jgi:hypothetical protein
LQLSNGNQKWTRPISKILKGWQLKMERVRHWNDTTFVWWQLKCHHSCLMATKLRYLTSITIEVFFPTFFYFFLLKKKGLGIVFQSMVSSLSMQKSPTIMSKGSNKRIFIKQSWVRCITFYINLWGNTTILYLQKCVFLHT